MMGGGEVYQEVVQKFLSNPSAKAALQGSGKQKPHELEQIG